VNRLKLFAGGVLAFLAMLIIGGSMLEPPPKHPQEIGIIVLAAVTFLSVVILQFLLWRFIVPSRIAKALECRPPVRPKPKPRRRFLNGTISFGYLCVAIYCVQLAGYLPPDRQDPTARNLGLFMGLIFIGLGMAAQLRDAFSKLAKMAGPDTPAPPTDQAIAQTLPSS